MALHWLFRGWLYNAARQKAYEAAEEVVREQLRKRSEASEEPDQPALPPPCEVGLVFATAAESGGLEDRLQGVTTVDAQAGVLKFGALRERYLAVVQSGSGRRRASRATEALILGHRPAMVIAAGFADSLAEPVKRGEMVIADRLADEAGHDRSIDFQADQVAGDLPAGVHVGRLLSLEEEVGPAKERKELGQLHDALAVDRESLGVAEVCYEKGVPFLAVRVIRHGLQDELPADIRHLKNQTTAVAKLGAVLGAVTRRPSSVKDMWQTKEDALVASDRLAEFLEEVIAEVVRK